MRKNIIKWLSLSVFFTILTGCMSQPVIQQPALQTDRVLHYSASKVWASTVKAVSQRFPIQIIEKDSGLINTQTATIPIGFDNSNYASYYYKPNLFLATWGGANIRLNVLVIPEDDNNTKLKINATYQALETNVMKSWIVVRSNGQEENRLLDEIEQDLISSKK